MWWRRCWWWRRGGGGRGGGGGEGGFENSYVAMCCRNQYLSSLHFLALVTYSTDHGVRFCSIPKSKLRVGITSRYLTGILITCMAITCILFMSHMHALLDLQHGSKSLVNLGDLFVGQSRTKISAMGTIRTCFQDFFSKLSLWLLLSTPRSTTSILQIYFLKILFS